MARPTNQTVAITLLIPGAEVSVSGKYVRVVMAEKTTYYDAIAIEEVTAKEVSALRFAPLVSIPTEPNQPAVLVQCDQAFVGDFTPRALRLIKQGAQYHTTLKEGITLPETGEEIELRCICGYVLRESSKGALLLGLLCWERE